MPDSAAERARRARRHKRGDHTLCDPTRRCEALELLDLEPLPTPMAAAPVAEPDEAPRRRGPRGQQLWDDLAGVDLPPTHRVLLDEACRIVDRLDRLDGALERKKTWLRFDTADTGEVIVIVDNVLAETRQQASTLKALIAEIRAAAPKPSAKPARPSAAKPKGGGLADLTARIAARGGSATG